MVRYQIFKMGIIIWVLCFCSACSGIKPDGVENKSVDHEEYYQKAIDLLETKEYEEAEKAFKLLENYKDSAKYASYAAGMRITVEIRSIQETYDAFIAAGDILDAEEYVKVLEPYIANCPGIYSDGGISYENFILINDELNMAFEHSAEEDAYYGYTLSAEMNDYYKIISSMGMCFSSSEEYAYEIEFSKDFQNIDTHNQDASSSDTYSKITEAQYEGKIRNQNNSELFDELDENLESYPLLDTDTAINILVGNTFEVNLWNDIAEYSFNNDQTYKVKTASGTNIYEWEIIDNNIYDIREGTPFYLYQVRKYFDEQYLICRYNINNDYYNIFISKCLNGKGVNDQGDKLVKENYFHECQDILTPDSIDERFKYEYTEQKDDIILHTYSVKANSQHEASDIIQIYYDYLCLNKKLRELEYNFKQDSSTGTFYITKDSSESMVAAMQGGIDDKIGYFITCSMKSVE